ncbi:MAG: hypothetical protein ACOYT4_02865 [Nanoarchaeota archaeon]
MKNKILPYLIGLGIFVNNPAYCANKILLERVIYSDSKIQGRLEKIDFSKTKNYLSGKMDKK